MDWTALRGFLIWLWEGTPVWVLPAALVYALIWRHGWPRISLGRKPKGQNESTKDP